jgi:hypothetical protein
MSPSATLAEVRARLHDAGWVAEEIVVPNAQSWDWLVTARRGEQKIEARGTSQQDAWQRAWQQSEAADLMGAC